MPDQATVDFLVEMRKRYDRAVESEREIREDFKTDMRFIVGDHWDTDVKKQRKNRPCLTINVLPEKVQQIVNTVRMQRPAGKVSPVDDRADKETAKIIQGLGRHIEYVSQARMAYDTAFEYAVSGGFGFWRYKTEYVSDDSFNQDIVIEPIMDPMAVYLDPDCKKSDGSDARYAFVIEEISREEFKRRYPEADVVSLNWHADYLRRAPGWFSGDNVQIAEYWVREEQEKTLLLMPADDGSEKPVLVDSYDQNAIGANVKKRRVMAVKVKSYVTNGVEILEENEWAGKYIPIVRVTGKELRVNGRKHLISAIRTSRDPQLLLNYAESAAAENCMLATKATWIGYVGQFKTKAEEWANSNLVSHAFLEVDPVVVGGQPAPFPQRNTYEPPIQALSLLSMRAQEHIKSSTGLYDPSLGRGEQERSGKAIGLLQKAGDIANYHLSDNLARGIWHGWRILIDLIPKIYDTERVVRILGPDESEEQVTINGEFDNKKKGRKQIYDVRVGRYDVTVEVGPSFNTKMQEAAANMTAFAQAVPELVPRWADLFVKAQDWPMADEVAERLTPPEFVKKDGQEPIPPQVQAMLQQAQQEFQAINEYAKGLESKNAEMQRTLDSKVMEIESRERMAAEQNRTQILIAKLKADTESNNKLLDAELEAIGKRMDLLRQEEPVQSEA